MEPIITNLLDMDFYKFSMGYFVWKIHPNVNVKYSLKNRGFPVLKEGDEERFLEQLEHVRSLKFTKEDINYLQRMNIFDDAYLEFLRDYQLPKLQVTFSPTGEYRDLDVYINAEGSWKETIYWETLIMSILTELHHRKHVECVRTPYICLENKATEKLIEKLNILKKYPGIRFADFGTRRRSHKAWHEKIIEIILDSSPVFGIPQFLGTSNVNFARQFRIKPVGTMAHELFMAYSAIYSESDESIRASSMKVLDDWQKVYGLDTSVALTDTWGSDFFFSVFDDEKTHSWTGLRQDSGNPYAFAEKALKHYGVMSPCKTIVFSDSLNVDLIVDLYLKYNNVFRVSFGWGTNLTNDDFLEDAPNIVVKLTEVEGIPVVKLSDTPEKAMGNSRQIEKMKRIHLV